MASFVRFSFLAISVIVSSSCGAALEKNRAQRAFESLHGCSDSRVIGGVGGYLVEGCGLRAHYVCTGHDTRNPIMEELLFGSADCIQDDVRRLGAPQPPAAPPSVRVARHEAGYPVLIGSIRAEGVRIRFLGAPTRAPQFAYVEMERPGELPPEGSCSERLWVEGDEVALDSAMLEEVESRIRYRARFDASWLARMSTATRITGVLCGEAFVLPAAAGGTVRQFDVRFRELASAGDDAEALAAAER